MASLRRTRAVGISYPFAANGGCDRSTLDSESSVTGGIVIGTIDDVLDGVRICATGS